MISFTDHNKINWPVYNAFNSKDTGITLIPGIELDTYLGDDPKNTKHIIFYFNIMDSKILKEFAKDVNEYIEKKSGNVQIDGFLDFLLSKNVEFIMSPHAFKQGDKAIDFDWNSEEITTSEAKKYMDQFFCFWEASGKSSIARAKQFLNDFDFDEKISVISFSDSSDRKKLEDYLNDPPQYFNCLPNFKGIQLAGTDCRRIVKTPYLIEDADKGNFIHRIEIDNQMVELIPRLNAVIGGRGSGKSILLDNIALNLGTQIGDSEFISKDRKEFLKSKTLKIFNYNGKELAIDEIKFDYYNQAYVSKIFDSNESNTSIQRYFSDEFEKIKDIQGDAIKLEIVGKFLGLLKKFETFEKSNISGLVEKFVITKNDKFPFKYYKKDINKLEKIEFVTKIEYDKNTINNTKIIPKQLSANTKIIKKLAELFEIINEEIYEYNDNKIIDNKKSYFIDAYFNYITEKSSTENSKKSIEESFDNNVKISQNKYIKRVSIINSYIELAKDFKEEYKENNIIDGFDENRLLFEKNLKIENPLVYLDKIIRKYFDGTKIKNIGLVELIDLFCFKCDEYIKDSKSYESFIEELTNINLQFTQSKRIYYSPKDTEQFEDLANLSPGTQTNILMEYIVSKDTTIPLLIDQPEDNIDNETIYGKLTDWFNKLKNKRQIIVVTHDANIVINSDAENIIVAKNLGNTIFEYKYGALEYDENLQDASVILDGGKEAVERRLKKYGE